MAEMTDQEYNALTAPVRKELAQFISVCVVNLPKVKANVAKLKASLTAAVKEFIDEHDKVAAEVIKGVKAVEREGRKLEKRMDEINGEPGQATDEVQSVGSFSDEVGRSIGSLDGEVMSLSSYKEGISELMRLPSGLEEILEDDYMAVAKDLIKELVA